MLSICDEIRILTGNNIFYTVPRKEFQKVNSCCAKECFKKFDERTQYAFFNDFYRTNKSKQLQDLHISNCIRKERRKSVSQMAATGRPNQWSYHINVNHQTNVSVCQQYLLQQYQISKKRLRVIQARTEAGDTLLSEQRGKHVNRANALKDNVVPLMMEHLRLIPTKLKHYDDTPKEYFRNPDLTKKKLYVAFREYYRQQTNTKLKMTYNTYVQIFNLRCSTHFSQPKTDVCNTCTVFNCLKKPTTAEREAQDLHSERHEQYKKLKAAFLKECKKQDSTTLVIEFDYSQNAPLPRLDCCEQFYKRLLWLYIFNIHIHNDDQSHIYSFLEGRAKKDPSSVCSFLFHCLRPYLESGKYTRLVLLSDSCGGQNKNITVVKFCAWLARLYRIEVDHLFPVRGHSFNICDRNFGLFRIANKKKKRVVDYEVYLGDLRNARTRPSPFHVTYDDSIIEDWEKALNPLFLTKPREKKAGRKGRVKYEFKIQSFVRIQYTSTYVRATNSYAMTPAAPAWLEFEFFKPKADHTVIDLEGVPPPGIKPQKVTDVTDLFKYLNPKELEKFRAFSGI